MKYQNITFQKTGLQDLETLEHIREKSFLPIFDSFRKILGDEIYERAQMPEDRAQKEILKSYFEEDNVWEIWSVIWKSSIIGFIAIHMNRESKVGEIGLNAIHPDYKGNGIGTQIYDFAVNRMKKHGMKVATVATGGDPSHIPARKAYQKAGFNVEIPSVWMCQILE